MALLKLYNRRLAGDSREQEPLRLFEAASLDNVQQTYRFEVRNSETDTLLWVYSFPVSQVTHLAMPQYSNMAKWWRPPLAGEINLLSREWHDNKGSKLSKSRNRLLFKCRTLEGNLVVRWYDAKRDNEIRKMCELPNFMLNPNTYLGKGMARLFSELLGITAAEEHFDLQDGAYVPFRGSWVYLARLKIPFETALRATGLWGNYEAYMVSRKLKLSTPEEFWALHTHGDMFGENTAYAAKAMPELLF